MRSDINAQLADYRGILGWAQFTDAYTGTVFKAIEIELYFKDFPIAIRKPKVTEINTISVIDHRSQMDRTTNLLFFGAPDILQVSAGGSIVTPTVSKQYTPKALDGTAFPVGNISYGEIVNAFIQGEISRTVAGPGLRVDPAYFISPYGQKYLN